MIFKEIFFSFSKPLTQDQEDVFISYFQSIRDHAKKQLKRTKGMIGNRLYSKFGQANTKTLALRMEDLINNIDSFMLLERVEGQEFQKYLFKVSSENINILPALPVIGKIDLWAKLEKRMYKNKKELVKALRLNESDLLIESGK